MTSDQYPDTVPFGIWHPGDTYDESEFFLYEDSGDVSCNNCIKLYQSPPKRDWIGLTDEEAAKCWNTSAVQTWKNIEAALKEKNE